MKNALEEIQNYDPGVLTLRALHYRMVSRGMTNTIRHYKRVVSAMIQARWDGIVPFETFSDHDREKLGVTQYTPTEVEEEAEYAKKQIKAWMTNYSKNTWENQDHYVEVWIEKKALQGVFQPICQELDVALCPCKGYPSLTFLNDAKNRFYSSENYWGKKPVIIYFGDYDPSGEDIPRSIKDNLYRMGMDVEVDRRMLLEDQVVEWKLPPAPAKKTDSRTANWDGLGQVELDAVEPTMLQDIVRESILEYRDQDKYERLQEIEEEERKEYRIQLKEYVNSL